MSRLIAVALLVSLALASSPRLGPVPASAQGYARFDVPDSALTRTLAGARGEYEAFAAGLMKQPGRMLFLVPKAASLGPVATPPPPPVVLPPR